MPDLYGFVDGQIRTMEERLRDYLQGKLSHEAMADTAWSVIDAWNAFPEEIRHGRPEAHEDVLWHAVWTVHHLADAEHQSDGAGAPLLYECLHLLEARAPLPQHYTARRP